MKTNVSRVIALFLLCVACEGESGLPEGSPDEIARAVEGMVRFEERWFPSGSSTPNQIRAKLESAEQFAQELFFDCQELASSPSLLGGTIGERTELRGCGWSITEQRPDTPSSCEEALCASLASQCVAERLYALSRQVEDYESTHYRKIFFENNYTYEVTVPPQSPRANAAMIEVATTYATHAITLSATYLEQMLEDLSSSTCRGWHLDDEIADPTGGDAQYYAEVLLSTFLEASDLQSTLAPEIERSFAAVADAERSRNASPAAAARYAWVEGRVNRSRGAHVLVGGTREDVLGQSGEPLNLDGLYRVPDGYGRLGALDTNAKVALRYIRTAAISPAYLDDGGSAVVDQVVAAIRLANDLFPADFGTEDVLESQGVTEVDYARAAAWLDDAISVFGLPRTLLLPDGTGRYAATATYRIVPLLRRVGRS